jgi:hypothetical protein
MSDPQFCPISRKHCSCDPRCDDEDYGSDYDKFSAYCVCDLEPDEEEQASGRCKSCGKPL